MAIIICEACWFSGYSAMDSWSRSLQLRRGRDAFEPWVRKIRTRDSVSHADTCACWDQQSLSSWVVDYVLTALASDLSLWYHWCGDKKKRGFHVTTLCRRYIYMAWRQSATLWNDAKDSRLWFTTFITPPPLYLLSDQTNAITAALIKYHNTSCISSRNIRFSTTTKQKSLNWAIDTKCCFVDTWQCLWNEKKMSQNDWSSLA